MSEFGIIVDVDLGINAEQSVLWVGGPRVDLNLGGIQLVEHLIQSLDLLSGLISLSLEIQLIDDSIDNLVGESILQIDWLNDDALWVSLGHLLDFNASILRSNDGRAL